MARIFDKYFIKRKTMMILWYGKSVHKFSPKHRNINLLELPFITLKILRMTDQESWP